MKTNQCDRERIDRFFQNGMLEADSELVLHLNSCAECRWYLDSQAAQPEMWLDAQRMLQPTEFDVVSPTKSSGGGQHRISDARQSPSIQAILDSLVPSEDPEHLGRLGTYEITGVVGAGGMGVVLKAFDRSLDRVVAVKVLAPHLASNNMARKRFLREAKAAAAVLHPNVIPIHGVASEAPLPYLVMSYIRGCSAQKRLELEGPLSTAEVLRIGSQVASGLAAAHEQGLIHRDIKPENILLEEGVERVTLTDFGLARAVDDTSVTRVGTIAGTPQYMSPEQARGEAVDQRSDLFSMGSVLYTLCTGSPPFQSDSSYGVMRKICDEEPTPIEETNADIPAWLVSVIQKLMAKKKTQRFNSAVEIHELLENCLSHVQQPGLVKLPAQLAKNQKLTFGKNLFRNRILRGGLVSMFTLVAAVAACVWFFPETSSSPQQTNQTTNGFLPVAEVLGNGYVRRGAFIYFDGQRIDQAGREDIDKFAKFTELDLKLATDVDAASFKSLSEEYTKDRNKVYYKWVSPGRFWIVELPQADATSFEVLGFNFARDKSNVWWYGQPLSNIDPATVQIVNDGFVWKDAENVWYQHDRIPGANAATFRHLEQAFYRDSDRVYWSSTPLTGADPNTFRTFGEDSPYGADQTNVWKGSDKVAGLDAASFEAVHQSIYKDQNGVYANGYPLENADPTSFRKVADLDEHLSAFFADKDNYYVYLPYRGETYWVANTNDMLQVRRQLWAPGTPLHQSKRVRPVAIATAELTVNGWRKQNVSIDEATEASQMTKDQEAHILNLHTSQFAKAWEILNQSPQGTRIVDSTTEQKVPADAKFPMAQWRTDVGAFNQYLSEFATAGRVPDVQTLRARVSIIPGAETVDSEVIPVTKNAGGFVDMNPDQDTVQFRVNEALKGQRVKWEFTLKNDVTTSFGGAASLAPSFPNGDAVPFLGSLFIDPAPGNESSFDYKAGDILQLEGTIGDFSRNAGIADLTSAKGTIAVYHLDSAPQTVFWVGLTDIILTSPSRKTAQHSQPPAENVTKFVRALLQATFDYDEQTLAEMYASEVRLLPGNRLFQFGLELPGDLSSYGVSVEREQLLPALNKLASRDPIPGALVAGITSLMTIEQLNASAGELVLKPNPSNDSVFDELRFTLEQGDVLVKISVPTAFRYLQLRQSGEKWKVVAEY